MTSILLPTYLYPDDESVEVLDRTSTVFRPEFALGIVQRQEQSAPILRVSQKYSGMASSDRGVLLSFLRQCRGRVNTIYLTPMRYAPRGSFPATELLTNNTFENGTTGWNAGAYNTLTVNDRVGRLTRTQNASGGSDSLRNSSAMSVTQYAPYVFRAMLAQGPGTYSGFSLRQGSTSGANDYGESSQSAEFGLKTLAAVPFGSSAYIDVVDYTTSGNKAGDYFAVPYTSLSRCALVDNADNGLLRSDEFDNASWTKTRCGATGNFLTAPDGTTTGDRLVEDSSASNTHYAVQPVTVSASAADYSFACALRAGTRDWASLTMEEATGGLAAYAFFNLSTGVVGTTLAQANWSNVRAFISPLGGGWYYCCVVARKTNAATTINSRVGLATGDNVFNYTGDGASYVSVWRATFRASSVPTRLFQSTGTLPGSQSQTGSALYIKGLPVSTNGLLLVGDLVEIGGELKQVKASLNSDAAGLGYLQFEPPLFRSPADNDPVIINNPMGKFILADNGKAANRLGRYADVDLAFEEIYE